MAFLVFVKEVGVFSTGLYIRFSGTPFIRLQLYHYSGSSEISGHWVRLTGSRVEHRTVVVEHDSGSASGDACFADDSSYLPSLAAPPNTS